MLERYKYQPKKYIITHIETISNEKRERRKRRSGVQENIGGKEENRNKA